MISNSEMGLSIFKTNWGQTGVKLGSNRGQTGFKMTWGSHRRCLRSNSIISTELRTVEMMMTWRCRTKGKGIWIRMGRGGQQEKQGKDPFPSRVWHHSVGGDYGSGCSYHKSDGVEVHGIRVALTSWPWNSSVLPTLFLGHTARIF